MKEKKYDEKHIKVTLLYKPIDSSKQQYYWNILVPCLILGISALQKMRHAIDYVQIGHILEIQYAICTWTVGVQLTADAEPMLV